MAWLGWVFSLSLLLAANGDVWSSFHHDLRNSGVGSAQWSWTDHGTCLRWEYEYSTTSFPGTGVLSQDGQTLFVPGNDGTLRALDLTGTLKWSYSASGTITEPAVVPYPGSGEFVVFGTSNNQTIAIDTGNSPTFKWSAPMPGPVVAAPAVDTASGLVYVSSSDIQQDENGVVVCLDANDGNLVWMKSAIGVTKDTPHGLHTMPAIDASRKYVAYYSIGDRLVAFSSGDGHVVGEVTGTSLDPFRSSPSLTSNNNLLLVMTQSGMVVAYTVGGDGDTVTFTLAWSCRYSSEGADCSTDLQVPEPPLEIGSYISPLCTPAVSADDSTAYITLYYPPGSPAKGGVVALSTLDGSYDWGFFGDSIDHLSSRSSPAIDKNGDVYVALQSPTRTILYCFTNTGAVKFSRVLGTIGATLLQASPVLGLSSLGSPRVYQGTYEAIIAVDPGLQCPSSSTTTECSSHGSCNCDKGKCACDDCWRGVDCATPYDCGGNGTCKNDMCYCNHCYSGPNCYTHEKCNGHGSCTKMGVCKCDHHWSGFNCTSHHHDDGGGLGTFFFILFLIAFFGGGGYYVYWRQKRRGESFGQFFSDIFSACAQFVSTKAPEVKQWFTKGASRSSGRRALLRGAGTGGYGATSSPGGKEGPYVQLEEKKSEGDDV